MFFSFFISGVTFVLYCLMLLLVHSTLLRCSCPHVFSCLLGSSDRVNVTSLWSEPNIVLMCTCCCFILVFDLGSTSMWSGVDVPVVALYVVCLSFLFFSVCRSISPVDFMNVFYVLVWFVRLSLAVSEIKSPIMIILPALEKWLIFSSNSSSIS